MPDMIRAVAFAAMLPSLAMAQSGLDIQRPDPIEVFTRGRHGNVMLDTIARWEDVSAPRSLTFDALVRVIKNHVDLRIEHADTIRKVVYNKRLIASIKLAGQPMSRWLRCGAGLTGDHANSWRITLAYAVFVDSVSANASRVGVALFATARDTDGVSTAAVACGSTGALEREIVGKVREVVQSL
jgi:hypothetical protein